VVERLDEFMRELAREGRARATLTAYRRDVGAFRTWIEATYRERFRAGDITPGAVRAYRNHMLRERRCRAATVNRSPAPPPGQSRPGVRRGAPLPLPPTGS
jgi:site-specific recombinase XerD